MSNTAHALIFHILHRVPILQQSLQNSPPGWAVWTSIPSKHCSRHSGNYGCRGGGRTPSTSVLSLPEARGRLGTPSVSWLQEPGQRALLPARALCVTRWRHSQGNGPAGRAGRARGGRTRWREEAGAATAAGGRRAGGHRAAAGGLDGGGTSRDWEARQSGARGKLGWRRRSTAGCSSSISTRRCGPLGVAGTETSGRSGTSCRVRADPGRREDKVCGGMTWGPGLAEPTMSSFPALLVRPLGKEHTVSRLLRVMQCLSRIEEGER